MTPLEEFKEMLDNHDWYFDMSDDPQEYAAGLEELRKIRMAANESYAHLQAYLDKKKLWGY